MKTRIKKISSFIWGAIFTILLVGCSNDNTSDLMLEGDTWLEAFQLDNYQGIIDNTKKTVVVNVPEHYSTTSMEVTDIKVSEGAEASIKLGEIINFSSPQNISITNGNAFFNYTITIKHDEAKITSFKLNDTYSGIIDEENHSILVRVPTSVDITQMTPNIETSEYATINPAAGQVLDFSEPVKFTVTFQTATAIYTVNVIQSDAPRAIYIGLASSLNELNYEEKEAATWMINTIPNAQYASFDDIRSERINLSQCKIMWWHLHIDGGIDNMDKFNNAAPQALQALAKIKEFYTNGGNLLLTRYASFYAALLGATKDGNNPNNCWGQSETTGEVTNGPWSFFIGNNENHPLYNELDIAEIDGKKGIYTCSAGYRTTNSTAQWHIGSDWGGYPTNADWIAKHGGKDLGYGGDGAIVVWEYPTTNTQGKILCIGSGCYDWYSHETDISSDPYHGNVSKLTKNAIDYLTNESNN